MNAVHSLLKSKPMTAAMQIQPQASDDARLAAYLPEVLGTAERLLGNLDREQHSVSYGSFDREHWGWKFRDYPLTMLQAGLYPLALLWRHEFRDSPYHGNPQILAWIEASIENICRRQHKNGAFDGPGPYTQEYGVSLAMAYFLTETERIMGDELTPYLRPVIQDVVRTSCEFALRSSEDYAFISNHHAHYALAFHNAYEFLGDERFSRRAQEIIDLIISKQSPDGWYREYGGPDPGYESLGIFYLATYWKRTGSSRLLDSLRHSIDFYSHCLHQDGSVGGVYGSRHTSLYYPGGFELLAAELPRAAAIARFMRERLASHNVVTPLVSDSENLSSLSYSYLEACLITDWPYEKEVPRLPCESLDGIRSFAESNIIVVGTRSYYAVLNASKGGVTRICDKRTGKIAYQDAGYIVRTGKRRWTSQLIGLGHGAVTTASHEVACETTFGEVRQLLPTPENYILLRLLNLTLFRSIRLGSWLRRQIVRRLITSMHPGPFRLNRLVTFGANSICFRDHLRMVGPQRLHVDEVALPCWFTAIHMGSAKYFHQCQLETTPQVRVGGITTQLNRTGEARFEFTLSFPDLLEPQLVVADASAHGET